MEQLGTKYQELLRRLRELGGVAVAFSGGVDSTLLLAAAKEALGDRAIAVTASSRSFPERELRESGELCRMLGVEQVFVEPREMELEGFRKNPRDRCYHCKRELFGRIWALARERGFAAVAEGSNVDDEGDYRPGMRAVAELGAVSPLREAGLNKAEIRELSRRMGLPTADKPSCACLASRFPYGQEITERGLSMVDRAEQWLMDRGFTQVRVRIHGELARIELVPGEMERALGLREELSAVFKDIGFAYTALDLTGYRTGSMNETLDKS